MKRIVSILLCACLLLLPVLAFSACDDNEGKIRLNEVTHSIFYAPQYLAMSLGYFEEAGLEIELINGAGADNTMTALLTKEADIGLMGPETTLYILISLDPHYLTRAFLLNSPLDCDIISFNNDTFYNSLNKKAFFV